jgi:hypothetical protein
MSLNIFLFLFFPKIAYNRKLGSNPLKQKAILMVYIGKVAFNIDGITIH